MQHPAMKTAWMLPVHFNNLKTRAVSSWKWIYSRWAAVLALGCGALCLIALVMATADKVVVGPFSVPKAYEERGYTSEAMSSAVVQFIHGNESTVSLAQPVRLLTADRSASAANADEMENAAESVDGKHVVSSFDPSDLPDIKVPLTSYSLEALIDLLRDTVGRRPTRIAGEIVSLSEADSSATEPDPQRAIVLIRYKIEYPEPSYPILGYHWWPRRTTTVTGTLNANGAEDVMRKLALITADALGRRTLTHEDKRSRMRRLISRGNTYFGLQDYGRAERMYVLANSLQKSGHAYLSMGVIEENEGNYGHAEELYREATQVQHDGEDDDPAWALLYWGNLLVRERQPSTALSKYLSLTKLPSNIHTLVVEAAAQNNLGFVYLFKRDWKNAEASFRAAERSGQQLQEYAQACAYSDGESSTCDDAQNEAERADDKAAAYLSIGPINHLLALTHYGLAKTLAKREAASASGAKQDDLVNIKQEYRASIQADAGYSRAHYQLALIYISEKSYQDAQDELQKTIQLEPGFERAYADWNALINRWEHLPGRQKSDRPLSRTLALDYRNWGDTFARAGNPDDAVERYCTAASLNPEYKGLCISGPPADSGTISLLNQPRW